MAGSPMGVNLHSGDLSMDEIVRFTQEAESLGYEGVWLPEESGKEAFAVLAILAQATKRIRLATGILSFYTRTPTLLAMGASTMDRLSGGRFALGLGIGGVGFMQRGHGVPTERPLARARETVEIVRGLLTSKKFTYQGQWFNVRDFHLREGPVERKIPIYLSALNPKMVGLSARIADGFIANWPTEESVAEWQSIVKREAEAAGRDPRSIEILTLVMTCVDPYDEAAMNVLRRAMAFYFASEHYHHIADISGFGGEAKAIKAAWDRGDVKAASRMVTDAMCEKFGLTGTPETCRTRLRWMLDAGVYPIIYPLPRHGRVMEDYIATIRLAAAYAA